MIFGLVMGEAYGGNEAFRPESPLNRDNCLAHLHLLRERLLERGIDLVTQDMTDPSGADAYLFLDYNEPFMQYLTKKGYRGKRHLVLFESEVVLGRNWIEANHGPFDTVFTWSPLLASTKSDRPRYVRYYWPNDLSRKKKPLPLESREGFCVMMAGNKWSHHPLELYSERLETLGWFLDNHGDDIDLYGPGWNPSLRKRISATARDALRHLLRPQRPSPYVERASKEGAGASWKNYGRRWVSYPFYRGMVPSKMEVLKNYRFSICYENGRDIPGYITEKIFDCFLAGVVPVYWGWEGASDLIPPEAFIDRRDFASHEALYRFLSSMDEKSYEGYLEAMGAFLDGEASGLFGIPHFVETILEGIAPPLIVDKAGDR